MQHKLNEFNVQVSVETSVSSLDEIENIIEESEKRIKDLKGRIKFKGLQIATAQNIELADDLERDLDDSLEELEIETLRLSDYYSIRDSWESNDYNYGGYFVGVETQLKNFQEEMEREQAETIEYFKTQEDLELCARAAGCTFRDFNLSEAKELERCIKNSTK